MNLIDAAIAWINPEQGLRRVAARERLNALERRGFDGASRRGRFENWRASSGDGDNELLSGMAVLRSRARDLVRNDPIAARGVQVLVDGIVGAGIVPRSATGNSSLDARVQSLWSDFCARADFDGRTDFYGLTSLAVREMVTAGEGLAVRRFANRRDATRIGLRVPLQIQMREAEHLDESKDTVAIGARSERNIRGGIEYDQDGRRLAYWMLPDHPGATRRLNGIEATRVSGDQVIHVYERQRLQGRGATWFAPVMRAIREMGEWSEAELVRKRTEACLAGVVIGDPEIGEESITGAVVDGNGHAVETFRPGMIAYARGGKDIKFTQPASTGGVYEWTSVQLHIIAAGLRVPYELLLGDLRQVNFSSSRVGMNAFRSFVEGIQWHVVIPQFCQPAWDWFIAAAKASGQLPDEAGAVEWDPPRIQSVNPLQDAQADIMEIRGGLASLGQKVGSRGYSVEQVLAEQAATLAMADTLGLVLDSDPRRVAKSGAAQAPEQTQE